MAVVLELVLVLGVIADVSGIMTGETWLYVSTLSYVEVHVEMPDCRMHHIAG